MVALCAARCGESATAYAHSRTEGQFSLDVLAWVASWATPTAALLGKGKGDGGGMRGVSNSIPDRYSWLKPSSADSVNFVDLDALDRPETASQIPSMMGLVLPVATNETVRAWEEKVRSRAVKIDARKGETVRDARAAIAASAPSSSPAPDQAHGRPRGGASQT